MALPGLDGVIYTALTSDPTVSGIVGAKVYALQAPAGIELPYIVFYLASGVVPNTQPRNDFNTVYRAESRADSRAGAETLSDAVFDVLHEAGLTTSGWTIYWAAVETEQHFIENYDGVQVYRRVIDVRLRGSKN